MIWSSTFAEKKLKKKKLLWQSPRSIETSETMKIVLSEKFVAQVHVNDVLTLEMKSKGKLVAFKKDKYVASIFATSLVEDQKKGKVTKWYTLKTHSGGTDTVVNKGSWRGRARSPSYNPLQMSMLISFTCRLPNDGGAKLRLSKSSSGSEGATIAQRRAMIIETPIQEISAGDIALIYGGIKDRRASLMPPVAAVGNSNHSSSSSVASSASTSSRASREQDVAKVLGTYTETFGYAEPVYIDFSDEDEEISDPPANASLKSSNNGEMGPVNNWNSEYQTLLEEFSVIANRGSHTRHDTRVVALELAKLESDFLQKAEQYGRIIISELFLDNKKKTIKPDTIGGHLGGAKYVVENAGIMFKVPDARLFMNDSKTTYSDAMGRANKVAGRELSGIRVLSSYFFETKSNVRMALPLTCLIDYLGFRLLCMSILPISSLTLRYGSENAGTDCNVKNSDTTLSVLLNEMGQALGLDLHRVYTDRGTKEVELRTPVDLEGHKGFDGRYYLVDTSRLMPPTCLEGEEALKSRIFYENFRVEAMPFLPPLSPDGLSRFASRLTEASTKLSDIQDRDLVLATRHLLGDHLKESSLKLINLAKSSNYIESFDLVSETHSFGLNNRYLGLILDHIPTDQNFLRHWIQSESIARVVKNKIRGLLRTSFQDANVVGSNLKEILASFLDGFFCAPKTPEWVEGTGKWVVEDLICRHHFSRSHAEDALALIHSDERLVCKKMRDTKEVVHTPLSYILQLVCDYAAIQLEPRVLEAIRSNQRHFDNRLLGITYMDIQLISKVKHLPLIERCSAFILFQQGIAAQTGADSAKLDYLQRAHQCVSRGLHSEPNNSSLLTLEGEILSREMLILKKQKDMAGLSVVQNIYLRCIMSFERAIEQNPENCLAMIRLATIYCDHGNTRRAEELFLSALEVDSCDVDSLKRYGDFLSQNLNQPNLAEPFYLRRSKILGSQQFVYQRELSKSGGLPKLAPKTKK
jgi:tetratricopeptide (TPR) repeat protein